MKKLIKDEGSFEVVGEASDGNQAFELMKNLLPDIAVLDISMPKMSGIDAARKAREQNLPIEVLILTMCKEEKIFNQAMDTGIKGYVLKENSMEDLLIGMKTVANGEYFLSPQISEYLMHRNKSERPAVMPRAQLKDLTNTEKRILKLISENKTSKEIGEALSSSFRTVQNHRANICLKLGFKGRNKLLEFALENKEPLKIESNC